MHLFFARFLSALCRPVGGYIISQSLSLLYLFQIMGVKFCFRSRCGFQLVLCFCVAELEVLLCVPELSTGTTDGPFDGIFPVGPVVYGSKVDLTT